MMPPRAVLTIRRPGRAASEHRRVDEPHRVGRLGQVNRHEVGAGEELLDGLDELDADLTGPLAAHERVVGDQVHPERRGPLGDQHSHPAQAEDAEGLAVQLDALPARPVPAPGLEVGVGLGHVAGLGEQQRERVLGRRDHVRLGGVHDHHAPAGGLGDVDVVETDAGPADHHELGARRPSTSAVTRVALRITSADAPATACSQIGRVEADADVHLVPGVAQGFEPAVGDRFGHENAMRHETRA